MHKRIRMSQTQVLIASMLVLSLLIVSALPIQVFADPALFKATLIAPGNANITRRQWGQIIANSMQQVGMRCAGHDGWHRPLPP